MRYVARPARLPARACRWPAACFSPPRGPAICRRLRPMSELAELAQLIKRCPDCDLCKTRTEAVPGEGPEDARIMFIGEGPGFNEDKSGRPFVGAAGKFLDQ